MTSNPFDKRRISTLDLPTLGNSLSLTEKAELREAAARLLMRAEHFVRHAEAMRRSAALFQFVEAGSVFKTDDPAAAVAKRNRQQPGLRHLAPETGNCSENQGTVIELAWPEAPPAE